MRDDQAAIIGEGHFRLSLESEEQKPGIIMDYDKDGNIVGFEILNVSEKIGKPGNIIYEFA